MDVCFRLVSAALGLLVFGVAFFLVCLKWLGMYDGLQALLHVSLWMLGLGVRVPDVSERCPARLPIFPAAVSSVLVLTSP